MATDYLEGKFPSYVLTEDTSVKPLKTYYYLSSGIYQRVLNAVATDNPKEKGWYQYVPNHTEEYRHNLMSYQINNIDHICGMMCMKLEQIPKTNLPRSTTDGTITLDWSSSFFDTNWNELIGNQPVPPFAVPFEMNLTVVKSLDLIVDALVTNDDPDSKITTLVNAINAIPACTGRTYTEWGYTFDPSSMGTASRIEDLYTCASLWNKTGYRKTLMFLQNKRDSYTAEADKAKVTVIINTMEACARTLVDLARRMTAIRIYEGDKFDCTFIEVPIRFSFKSKLYYRLCFREQLVAGHQYGQVMVNGSRELEMIEMTEPSDPTSKFITLDLPHYRDDLYPSDEQMQHDLIQNGKLWYTDVPFNGVLS